MVQEIDTRAPSWSVAFRHWLIAGFFLPLGIFSLLSIVWRLMGLSFLSGEIADLFITPFLFWFGARASAVHILKSQQINDSNEIARLSLIYLCIISGGARIYSLFYNTSFDALLMVNELAFVVSAVAYYYASKKYFKQS